MEDEIKKELKKAFVEDCKRKWKLFHDKLSPFAMYTDDIMEKCDSYEIWSELMNDARRAKVNLREHGREAKRIKREFAPQAEPVKPIKPLEDYTTEELQKLYKVQSVCILTEWFKNRKRYHNEPIIDILDVTKTQQDHLRFLNVCKIKNIVHQLETDEDVDNIEKENLLNQKIVFETCNEVLFWCAGGFVQVKQMYDAGKEVQNPVELFNELHEYDDFDIKFGRATKWDIYLFIWSTLRYCSAKELANLLKLSEKKFIVRDVGRPVVEKVILKFDRFGNLVETFKSRQECMEKDNIGKQCLSHVITGKRKAYHGFKYVEKESI